MIEPDKEIYELFSKIKQNAILMDLNAGTNIISVNPDKAEEAIISIVKVLEKIILNEKADSKKLAELFKDKYQEKIMDYVSKL